MSNRMWWGVFAPLILLVFLPALSYSHIAITDDELNLSFHKPFWEVLTQPHIGMYSPLVYAVWHFIKDSYLLCHGANILLHTTNAFLVFRLCRMFGTNGLSVVGAAVFAFHPVVVEPVVWITGLRDTLSTFLCLAAVVLFLKGNLRSYLFLLVAAMLAKPTAGAVSLFVLALAPNRESFVGVVAFIFFCGINSTLQWSPDWSWHNLFIGVDSLGFYTLTLNPLQKFLPDYGRYGVEAATFFVGLVVPYLVWRSGSIGLLFSLVALLPHLGFIPYANMGTTQVTDRYAYLALAGIAIFIAQTPNIKYAAAVILLGGLIQTPQQVRYWKDVTTLYAYSLEDDWQHKPTTLMVNSIIHSRQGNDEESVRYLHKAKEAYFYREQIFWRF